MTRASDSYDYMFSDYVEVVTSSYDCYDYETIIFTPVISSEIGLYLYSENYKPIKNIFLQGSRLVIHYIDGSEELLERKVESVLISGDNFKQKMRINIEDKLFRYGVSEAALYNLDMTKAFNHIEGNHMVKKRSI